ncbi:MAG: sialidase family protein [Patescibacteria group bacterium]
MPEAAEAFVRGENIPSPNVQGTNRSRRVLVPPFQLPTAVPQGRRNLHLAINMVKVATFNSHLGGGAGEAYGDMAILMGR